ncbi:MAG: hypothetical protein F6K31_32065 [Symploca sp. SIO2G7]|nr:hypothetical protein [Symploca sp. SIO2G7]
MSAQTHIINQVVLDVETGQLADVSSLQQEISQLLWQKAAPQMENLFDQLIDPNAVVSLEQLVLTLPQLAPHDLSADFVPALINALHSTLRDFLAGYAADGLVSARNVQSSIVADWEMFLYFLDYGRLPWWNPATSWQNWIGRWQTALQDKSQEQTSLRTLLASSPVAVERLIGQFSVSFRHQLLLQLQPTWGQVQEQFDQAHQLMQSLALDSTTVQSLDHQAWHLVLTALGQVHPQESLPHTVWRDWLQFLVDGLHQDRVWPSVRESFSEESFSEELSIDTDMEGLRELSQGEGQQDRAGPLPLSGESLVIRQLRRVMMTWSDGVRWLTALDQITLPLVLPYPTVEPRSSIAPTISEANPLANGDHFTIASQPRPESLVTGGTRLSPDEATAGIYLNQAGIVLLHPFLPPYFEAVGLLANRQFKDVACQQLAIYLLHYLATKATDPPEYELVLPKLLCGCPLDTPVVPPALPAMALEEAENLLQATIDYWQALKSTQPDGLREGFLQREGKLTRSNESTWKLQVEQRSIDILLSRLPWNITMVKLPWMDDLLTVEWG